MTFSRLVRAAVLVFVTASLGGCAGGGTAPFGASLFGSKTYALSPIVGAPAKVSEEMSRLLVEQGQARGITIVPEGQEAPLTLRGYLVASRERRGATVSYIWDVNDQNGKRVTRVSGEQQVPRPRSDPWSGVGTAELRQIADKTVAGLTGRGGAADPDPAPAPTSGSTPTSSTDGTSGGGTGLGGFFNRNFGGGSPSGTEDAPTNASQTAPPATAAAPVAATGPATTLVAPVTGAPGDGQSSLANALRKRLSAEGIPLARSRGQNVYTVQGRVSITSAGGNRETVRIDWKVLDPSGKNLGTVSQQNTISKGSLNGPWGAIADAAAGAAADGIIKLLPKRRG